MGDLYRTLLEVWVRNGGVLCVSSCFAAVSTIVSARKPNPPTPAVI